MVPSRRPHPRCTLFPPHEQLLVAAVGGAVVVGVPRHRLLSLSSVVVVAISTCYPPHEQLLVRLGAGGGSFVTMGGRGGAMALVWVVVICFGGVWVGQCDVAH